MKKTYLNRYFSIFTLLKVLLLLSMNTAQAQTGRSAISPAPDSLLNQKLPEFKLKNLNGRLVSLADFRGKTLIIDFWATWCEPCKAYFPTAQLLVNHYAHDRQVAFLFIDIKEKITDYPAVIRRYLAANHFSFNVVLDEKGDDGLQNLYWKQMHLMGIPARLIIDRNGIVRDIHIGIKPGDAASKTAADQSLIIETVKSAIIKDLSGDYKNDKHQSASFKKDD